MWVPVQRESDAVGKEWVQIGTHSAGLHITCSTISVDPNSARAWVALSPSSSFPYMGIIPYVKVGTAVAFTGAAFRAGSYNTYALQVKALGARLPTYDELCPNGEASRPVGGQRKAVSWLPIQPRSDGSRWVQVGADVGPFNCRCYLDRYGDLSQAYGENCIKALMHYLQHGVKEGRYAGCHASDEKHYVRTCGTVGPEPTDLSSLLNKEGAKSAFKGIIGFVPFAPSKVTSCGNYCHCVQRVRKSDYGSSWQPFRCVLRPPSDDLFRDLSGRYPNGGVYPHTLRTLTYSSSSSFLLKPQRHQRRPICQQLTRIPS
jgi:hypothetical protein